MKYKLVQLSLIVPESEAEFISQEATDVLSSAGMSTFSCETLEMSESDLQSARNQGII